MVTNFMSGFLKFSYLLLRFSTESTIFKYFNFREYNVVPSRMVSAVEYSFSFVIMAQIFCMSIMVCSLGFQILGVSSISKHANYIYTITELLPTQMLDGTTGDKPSPLQVLTLVGTLFTLMTHTLVDCFACETLALRVSISFFSHSISRVHSICNAEDVPEHRDIPQRLQQQVVLGTEAE